jgi:CspA family cold shock protein
MPTGTVKWFNRTKGYGFLTTEDESRDMFVHISAIEAAGLATLQEGQAVSYDVDQDRRGRAAAINIKLLEQDADAPAEEAPADDAPTEETPADDASEDDAPADDAPEEDPAG